MTEAWKKFTKKELARLANTAPEYLSACSTGKAVPSLDFIIRVMESAPGRLRVEDVSPRIAEKISRIAGLELQND